MNRFKQSYPLLAGFAKFIIGILVTATLTTTLILSGENCRLGTIYVGLLWGVSLGPAMSICLFSYLRHRRWGRVILLFPVVTIFNLFLLSLLLPGTFGAIHRAKRVKAMADMRAIGRSLEAGSIPSAWVDPWGAPYVVDQRSDGYRIVSYGECSQPDVPPGSAYPEGVTSLYEADLVYSDGVFLRYPEGEQP